MKNKKTKLPIVLPKPKFARVIFRAFYSFSNFAKASVLSLVVLVAILMLLTQMEQAYTMLLLMVEVDKMSLLLCFLMINLLALSFSHFPIYTYFAGNLNNSKKSVKWEEVKPFSFPLFSWIRLQIYEPIPTEKSGYVADDWANILRQTLGLVIYFIWILFIHSAFKPNLIYLTWYEPYIQIFCYCSALLPFFLYAHYRIKMSPNATSEETRKKLQRRAAILSVVFFSLSVISLLTCLAFDNLFSPLGWLLLLLTTFFMMMHYVFYRLIRPKLADVLEALNESKKFIMERVVRIIHRFNKPTSFLSLFIFSFLFCFLLIIYFNLASLNNWILPNGILIVLIYVYFYYYIIAVLGKFFFVQMSLAADKKREQEVDNQDTEVSEESLINPLDTYLFKGITIFLFIFVFSFIAGFFTESNQNELKISPIHSKANHATVEDFMDQIKNGPDTVFFVASHGGGLKANAWTLNILNELDVMSDGKFISQTAAFSGASGGSLGLALYGNILHEKKGNRDSINQVIDTIEHGNFASADVALLFGFDFLRSLYPLNQLIRTKNRANVSMLNYQNKIAKTESSILDETDFRTYWSSIKCRDKNLPALIMNTASTRGKRGIFYSLKSPSFDSIFPFSQNLADLRNYCNDLASLSFYNAVSTTNRFPIFSPAAKIKGYGHFIDAGAIDNSGLLGCWDMYLYFRGKGAFANKVVVFVEIINGKSNYIEHILKDFTLDNPKLPMKLNENEKSSILANLETGLNLNKIPGYLDGFMGNYVTGRDTLKYHQIYLPHKVSIEDVEGVLNAKILKGSFRTKFKAHLYNRNKKILHSTDPTIGFTQPWKYYEPVLSRQLSLANINYYQIMKNHKLSGIESLRQYFKK